MKRAFSELGHEDTRETHETSNGTVSEARNRIKRLNAPYETVDPGSNKFVRSEYVQCAYKGCKELLDSVAYHGRRARKCGGSYVCAAHTVCVLGNNGKNRQICENCNNELKSCTECAKRGTTGNRHLYCFNALGLDPACPRHPPSERRKTDPRSD